MTKNEKLLASKMFKYFSIKLGDCNCNGNLDQFDENYLDLSDFCVASFLSKKINCS